MKFAELKKHFEDFAKAKHKTIEESRFENGYGSKYISAKPGTIFLRAGDPRLGRNLCAIYRNNKSGGVTMLTEHMTYKEMYQFMEGQTTNIFKR